MSESVSAPASLHLTGITAESYTLAWHPSNTDGVEVEYVVYAGGLELGRTRDTEYTVSGRTPGSEDRVSVAAVAGEQLSLPSNVVSVALPAQQITEWQLGTSYQAGDQVGFQGRAYSCIQAHTSNSGWVPDATEWILWAPIK